MAPQCPRDTGIQPKVPSGIPSLCPPPPGVHLYGSSHPLSWAFAHSVPSTCEDVWVSSLVIPHDSQEAVCGHLEIPTQTWASAFS